jgi:hypothetical protein
VTRLLVLGLLRHVGLGEHPDQLIVVDDRKPANLVLRHQLHGVVE